MTLFKESAKIEKVKKEERKMTDLRSLEVALTLIDVFNGNHGEDLEKLAVGSILQRMRFKELKTFNFKNLRRFHEINRERKIPNNGIITPENTLLSQEILYYLEYLEENTIFIPEDWGKPKKEISYEEARWVCEKYSPTPTQLKALEEGNLEILKGGGW